jgi:hypothetical protein
MAGSLRVPFTRSAILTSPPSSTLTDSDVLRVAARGRQVGRGCLIPPAEPVHELPQAQCQVRIVRREPQSFAVCHLGSSVLPPHHSDFSEREMSQRILRVRFHGGLGGPLRCLPMASS